MKLGPFSARLAGALGGAILTGLTVLGIEATDQIVLAVDAFSAALITFLGLVSYGFLHKSLDRGRDG